MISMDKAIQAAALAMRSIPNFTGGHDAERFARAAIEAAAPLLRAEVEREVVKFIWANVGLSAEDIAYAIERGDHRK